MGREKARRQDTRARALFQLFALLHQHVAATLEEMKMMRIRQGLLAKIVMEGYCQKNESLYEMFY